MLQDYFSLQLKFAAHYALKAAVPHVVAIERCTNLRRRLNLWGDAGEIQWNRLLAGIQNTGSDPAEQAAWCADFQRPQLEAGLERSFGCFSYDPPDATGTLRIHFLPPNGINSSPLASESIGARMTELRDLFAHVLHHESKVKTVRGVSWLYNLHAYRRLFPRPYSASVQSAWFPLHLNGSSTWGQVLNWRQEVKTKVQDQLLTRLDDMQVEMPWRVFPLQAMIATGQIELFYEQFT